MINEEQKQQINDVLRKSVEEISISESQHRTLVQSYGAVGDFLAEHEALKPFHPEIHPQGSVRLGTAIKPIAEEDDLDIDLVCEFKKIPRTWTQKDLKDAVGNCLKESGIVKVRRRDIIWTSFHPLWRTTMESCSKHLTIRIMVNWRFISQTRG